MGIEDRAGSSQEQKRIATTLALMDGCSFEDLKESSTNFTDGKTQDHYLRRAVAVLEDLEELSHNKPERVSSKEAKEILVQLESYVRLIVCPFCKEDGFDLVGLKFHMAHYCEEYQKTDFE